MASHARVRALFIERDAVAHITSIGTLDPRPPESLVIIQVCRVVRLLLCLLVGLAIMPET